MKENRDGWLASLRVREGGFVDHPEDDGGPTNMGITLPTLSEHLDRPATLAELKALTWEDVKPIYCTLYWNKIKGDALPSGLDRALADAVVTSKMPGQVKLLQNILGVEEDGYVGNDTIAAARKADTAATIREFIAARLAYMKTLPDWKHFGNGWKNRCDIIQAECLELVQTNLVESGAPKVGAQVGIATTILSVLAIALPEIMVQSDRTVAAVETGNWSAIAVALVGTFAGLLTAWLRMRAHVKAQPS